MLYNEDIKFNGKKYKNISHLLESLIKNGALKPMTIEEKSTLLNILEKNMLIK